MSVSYTWVQWNKHKRVYDAVLALLIVLFVAAYLGISAMATPAGQATSPLILLIRATGSCAIVMLHLILAIGPLARLFPNQFAPLLYNRRHFGVTMFFVGLVHGALVLLWYGGFGIVDPITAMLTMNPRYDSWVGFPFEVFGILALTILFLMAATSHDFWLKNLSPRCWKTLHMGVYVAYASLVLHVALGAVQAERSMVYPLFIGGGALTLISLHLIAGLREVKVDAS
nr:ferric reductase-like transmembrane domain-containing protein [Phycisphaeraceae bacterium]